jgi:uncharacterized OB-fold protein
VSAAPSRPLPSPSPVSAPFWAAAAEGRLGIQRCTTCGHWQWTPLPACPHCLTETLAWTEVSGRGTVWSWTVVHRPASPAFRAPYVVAIVELADAPVRMLTDLVGVDTGDVHIGLAVRVCFDGEEPLALYHFTAGKTGGGIA